MPSNKSTNNLVILAAAGSRKTEHIVDSALAAASGRVLITTFTNENQRHILRRIEQKAGFVPPHITVLGWFSFLIGQCAKPYQRALTGMPLLIRGLNFKGEHSRSAKKTELRYFLDKNSDLYRSNTSDFVVQLDKETDGAVIRRLERSFTHIFVDEVQDLSGYDLDVLDLLLQSSVSTMLVGDPRQHTLNTHIEHRNKKYRGVQLAAWFAERAAYCTMAPRTESYRCNQLICDFADGIYPDMPRTVSVGVEATEHDGIFRVANAELGEYIARYSPVTILRHSKATRTRGFPAMNIGVAKGNTFDRVLIFPTKPMLNYLDHRDPSKLKAPERLYVAVTRARWSVAFAVP